MFTAISTCLANTFTQLKKNTYFVPGQKYQIVLVPQLVHSFDVGHICMVITNPDKSEVSIGFYPERYLNTTLFSDNIFATSKSVLVSPDPLLNKALKTPALNSGVAVIYTGSLTQRHANRLNTLTFSKGLDEEGCVGANNTTIVRGMPETYTMFPMFVKDGDNCVSWIQKMFPIRCTLSIPGMCMEDPVRARVKPNDL